MMDFNLLLLFNLISRATGRAICDSLDYLFNIILFTIYFNIILYYISNTPGKNSLRQRQQPVAAENRAHVARGMTLKKKLYIDDLTVLVGPHA